MNGGTCNTMSLGRKKRQTTVALGYYCQCPTTYTGQRCETYLPLCGTNPCRNNGTCYQDSVANRIYCICIPNYTGTLCDTPSNRTNVCLTNPSLCVNNGTCRANTSSPLGFQCVCPPTQTGVYCEQTLDPCKTVPTPCLNNGTCVS